MSYTKREKLEKEFLGKDVVITLFDNDVLEGVLHKTGEECFKHDANLYVPKDRYFVTDSDNHVKKCIFKVSHIKKIHLV